MHYITRPATKNDLIYLLDTDIKCSDVPWSQGAWEEVLETCNVFAAVTQGKIVGVAVFQIMDLNTLCLVKVGVKREHRRRGLSRMLFACGLRMAGGRDIYALVPEGTLLPGDPYDLSQWLLALGLTPQKPLLRDCFILYGEKEDAVRFVFFNPERQHESQPAPPETQSPGGAGQASVGHRTQETTPQGSPDREGDE
jgi:hypothetical protein